MGLRTRIAAAIVLTSLGVNAVAEPFGYGEAFDTLYRIDLATGQAQAIGPAGSIEGIRIAYLEGLTYAPNGELYAVSDGVKALVRLDVKTGAATVIGSGGITGQSGQLDPALAFTCDGRLWMSTAATGKFWQVDPGTGVATLVGNLGYKITGLAAHDNILYGAGSNGDEGLYRIDPATAQTTLIGRFGSTVPYASAVGLSFDNVGQLWASVAYNPPRHDSDPLVKWNDYAKVDLVTGAVTVLGPITGPNPLQFVSIKGLAIPSNACLTGNATATPLPAISHLGLLLLGVLIALGTTFKKRRPKKEC